MWDVGARRLMNVKKKVVHLARIDRLLRIWSVGLVEMMRFNLRQVNGGERHVGSS